VDSPLLRRRLRQLAEDAAETRARCQELERILGTEQELLAHAVKVRERSADLSGSWFKAGTGPLRAWTFLAMGEAAEVAAWRAVAELGRREPAVRRLADWAVPVQERHLRTALDGVSLLAG
jgi:hypothetical protein